MNNVAMVGRLTKDPDLRYTPNGVAVANFTLAVNRRFPNKQTGEREADFIQCQVWQKTAENVANFLKKGSQAAVSGRWETGSFEGQDGKRVYTNTLVGEDVRFLDPAGNRQNDGQGTPNTQTQGNTQQQAPNSTHGITTPNYERAGVDPFMNGSGPIEVSDDDLPF